MPLPNLEFEPQTITTSDGHAALVAAAKRALAATAPQTTGESSTTCVIIPQWIYENLVERYSLTWPDDVLHDARSREEVRAECAAIAERLGHPEVASAIRASTPDYPPIG